jgi:hypothetical protein
MPFKSDAQRRWGHTDEGEKALGGPKAVNEWDQATKGKELPEHVKKMAEGGVVDNKIDYKKAIMDAWDDLKNGRPLAKDSTLGTDTTGLQGIANKLAGVHPSSATVPSTPQFNPKAGLPPQMAEGGVVDDQGVDLTQLPQGMPPPMAMPMAMPPQTPPPAMPQGDISSYIQGQKQQMNQYGPEQQMAVQKSILDRQRSPGSLVGQGLAGMGDAIMQGVARAGSGNFLNNLQNRQQEQGKMQIEGLQNARTANMQNTEQGQRLDAMDPNSQLSKAKQAANGPILSAMGFDPQTVGKMSAAEMDTAMSLLKDFRGKDLEVAVARYKAQIEANALAETTRQHGAENALKSQGLAQEAKHQTAEEGLKESETQMGGLKNLASEPLMSRLSGMVGLNPAQKALGQQVGIGAQAPGGTPHPDDARAIAYATDPKTRTTPQAAKIRAIHGIP